MRVKSENQVICPKCKKEKNIHNNRYGVCQMCYREINGQYGFRFYKYENKKYKPLIRMVLNLGVENNKSVREIANELEITEAYVRKILKENTYLGDTFGNPKPEKINF